jgi:hypothetical protein
MVRAGDGVGRPRPTVPVENGKKPRAEGWLQATDAYGSLLRRIHIEKNCEPPP